MIRVVLSDFSYVLANPKDNGWEINQQLLVYYQKLQKNQISINIYTASQVCELPEIKAKLTPVVSQIFSSKQLNLTKTEPKSYYRLAKKLNHLPEEIVFVDDQLVNVEAAREAGMQIVYFTTTQEAVKKLAALVK